MRTAADTAVTVAVVAAAGNCAEVVVVVAAAAGGGRSQDRDTDRRLDLADTCDADTAAAVVVAAAAARIGWEADHTVDNKVAEEDMRLHCCNPSLVVAAVVVVPAVH